MTGKARPPLDRFTLRYSIDTNGCWIWNGSRNRLGYGFFSLNRKTHLAHRAAYALFRGDITPGLFVCHRCDVPACVNPDHLFLGTQKDNIADARSKGRLRGMPRKITLEQRREIKESKERTSVLARRYGVRPALISTYRGPLRDKP